MKIEAIKCQDCGRIGLAVDDTRITNHKCSGAWTTVAETLYLDPAHSRLVEAVEGWRAATLTKLQHGRANRMEVLLEKAIRARGKGA